MEALWIQRKRQNQFKIIIGKIYQDADSVKRKDTQQEIAQNLKKLKNRRRKICNKLSQLYCTQEGKFYRRKLYQGLELHQSITETNNIILKRMLEGTKGRVLFRKQEEDGNSEREED